MDRGAHWPSPEDPLIHVRFLPDGGLARTTWRHRVEFLGPSGRPSARPPIFGGAAQPVGLEIARSGHRLAVGWNDGRIEIHDETGTPTRSIRANSQPFALSPDGQWLALVGPGNSVELHPAHGDGPVVTLGSHRDPITSFAFSPDGATLASASWDQTATLWDLGRRERRVILRGHKEKVSDLAFSPDGDWIATSSHDYTARIWDVRTGQTLAVLPGRSFIHAVAFSPNGRYLAVDDLAGTVRVYQLRGRLERRWLVGHNNGVNDLAFHPRLARVASAADDSATFVWDLESARPVRHWKVSALGVETVTYSPDGSLLATGGVLAEDGLIRVWDAETGAPRGTLAGHAASVRALAFDASGRQLATGDTAGVLILWDVATGRALRREQVGPSGIWSIAFIDGGHRLATAVSDGPVVVYDLEGTAPPRRVAVPGGMRRFVFDPTRDALIVAGNAGMLTRVSLRDLAVGRHLDKGHDGAIESLALARDGRILVTGGVSDRRVVVRDAATFEPLLTLPPWTGIVKDLAFDSSGRWLAIAGADSDVGLWDLRLVRDGLAAAGLAWDRPAPEVDPSSGTSAPGPSAPPGVAVLRPDKPPMVAAKPDAPDPAAPAYVGIGVVTTNDPDGIRIVRVAPGGPAETEGQLRPGDVIVGTEPGLVFAGRPLEEISAALRGEPGTKVRLVVRPAGLRTRAVYELTRAEVRPPHWFSELSALDDAVAGKPDDPAPRIHRGEHLGRYGDRPGALADFVRALELNPADHLPWYRAAPLYLDLGDLDGYRRHCRAMLARFGATDDPIIAERTAKACLLAPGHPVDPRTLVALAGRSVAAGANHGYIDYFRLALAMAMARCGDPALAIPELESVRDVRGDAYREALAGFFLAMAYQKVGRPADARAALAAALQTSLADAPQPPGSDLGAAWADWLVCRIVGREAEAAVLYDPIFPDDPFAR
jgi:WD40 repeat protein/tetratricopeptide (TPR) repeat protein